MGRGAAGEGGGKRGIINIFAIFLFISFFLFFF